MRPSTTSHPLYVHGVVKNLSHGVYAADLVSTFCIGNVPHGGFLAYLFLETARSHLHGGVHQNMTLGHWEFLFPAKVGRAILLVEEAKKGKKMSVLHIKLYQGGISDNAPWITSSSYQATTAYITAEESETNTGVSIPTGWHSEPLPMPSLDLLPPGGDGNWRRLYAPPVAKALQYVEFYSLIPQDPKLAMRDYWVRLAEGGTFSTASLGFVCDVGPPVFIDSFRAATEKTDARSSNRTESWYPTLVMDMQTKKQLPETGIEWMRLRLQAKTVHNGRLDVEVLIYDELGHLLAASHHVVMIVDMEEKNTARGGQKANI